MRILVISTTTFRQGGIAEVIKNLYANEVFAQDQITFMFRKAPGAQPHEIFERWGHEIIEYTGRLKRPLQHVSFLKQFIKQRKIEIVHVHGNSATCTAELAAAKAAGVPVRIMHGHNVRCEYLLLHKILRPVMNTLATARFACSKEAGAFLFGKKDHTVILNAFALEKFQEDPALREQLRKQYGVENKIVLGHVGLFNHQKNQEFLLRILTCYQKHKENAVLVLIGEGARRQLVQEEAKKLGLADSVFFLGARDDVPKLLNMLDYFVFPSVFEGFGIAPVEAQVNGLPTLASKGRLPANVQINDNFRFVALEDGPETWCEALLQLPQERCASAMENARKAGFDRINEAKQLRQRYVDLLKG